MTERNSICCFEFPRCQDNNNLPLHEHCWRQTTWKLEKKFFLFVFFNCCSLFAEQHLNSQIIVLPTMVSLKMQWIFFFGNKTKKKIKARSPDRFFERKYYYFFSFYFNLLCCYHIVKHVVYCFRYHFYQI